MNPMTFTEWFYHNENRFFWIDDPDYLSLKDEEYLTALYLRYLKDFNEARQHHG